MLAMYNGQYNAENDEVTTMLKIVVWHHSVHQFWTPYMWSMSLDRCSPAFSVNDKKFQKVTNWSALVPGISSEQRNLWPHICDLVVFGSGIAPLQPRSVNDKKFQKVTNWSALVPGMSSEQHDLWPFVIYAYWMLSCLNVMELVSESPNWNWCPVSSEQRNLWPFHLLDLVWMQWN